MPECTRSVGSPLVTSSLKVIVGTAANSTASALWILNLRSGTDHLARFRPRPDLGEETGDRVPDFRTAGEPFPVQPDQSDEPEAMIDRHEVVLRPMVDECGLSRPDSQPIDDQR